MINVIGNTRIYDGNAKNDKDRIFGIDGIGGALRGSDYKDPLKIAIPVMTPDYTNKSQNGRRFKEDGEEMYSLTSQDRHGVAIGVQMSGHTMKENNGISNCLNANDNRKIFGANQERTMAAVKIKKATKQGYAIARGGEMRSISHCREVRQEEDESG